MNADSVSKLEGWKREILKNAVSFDFQSHVRDAYGSFCMEK
jgi:hypothetical protein